MTIEDEFRLLIGGYYGIYEMDEYPLKNYILRDIEKYIKDFISEYKISNFDYKKEAELISNTLSLKRKLQDSLIVLNKIKAPLELILMVRHRLNDLKEFDY